MAPAYRAIDLNTGDVPDLAQVAEDVHRTKQPRSIRRADEELAVLMPAVRRHTQPRGIPFTHDDGLGQVVGSGHTADPTEIVRHTEQRQQEPPRPIPRKQAESPQTFYERVTKREQVRRLLRKLATR